MLYPTWILHLRKQVQKLLVLVACVLKVDLYFFDIIRPYPESHSNYRRIFNVIFSANLITFIVFIQLAKTEAPMASITDHVEIHSRECNLHQSYRRNLELRLFHLHNYNSSLRTSSLAADYVPRAGVNYDRHGDTVVWSTLPSSPNAMIQAARPPPATF